MSGPVANNIFRSSGVVAAAAGGLSWQPVVTASTLTASAGNGYFINTTSNACTITLPSSAEAGDQIILVDYARTWGTNAITIDSNGLNFQGEDDTYIVDYDTSGQAVNLVYSGATIGWTPSSDIVNALEPVAPQQGIFAYGQDASGVVSMSNIVSTTGVVAADVTGVGSARAGLAAANYGTDKAIFAFGASDAIGKVNTRNLVNSSGVIAADATGAGTGRTTLAATGYGSTGQAVFAYGQTGGGGTGIGNIRNLVSNEGVVASDATGAGTARREPAAARYGTDTAIFGFGYSGSSWLSVSNLVSNSGVIATDTTGVGTIRAQLAAVSYGTDKAIFGFGQNSSGSSVSMTNKVSNSGVVATDTTGVGTARRVLAATKYGIDTAIFGYGYDDSSDSSLTNKVSNTGIVASDVTGVGTARYGLAAAEFG